jgi:hypothetical protein
MKNIAIITWKAISLPCVMRRGEGREVPRGADAGLKSHQVPDPVTAPYSRAQVCAPAEGLKNVDSTISLVSETKPRKRECDGTENGHRKECRSSELGVENPREKGQHGSQAT